MEPTGDTASAAQKRDAQEPCTCLRATTFRDQLARMVDDPRNADVQLLVGEESTPVYASKVILMARSPVFKALLGGCFREAQPPQPASSSPSASSSSSSSSLETWSSSLPPVFWHWAEVPDVEPCAMRHLLHFLYTDQLHPDLATSPAAASARAPTYYEDHKDATMTQQEQDLVALYAAADRYLVDTAKALVRAKLWRHFDSVNGDATHVLAAFDLALAVAPELAESVFQPHIETNAYLFLCGHVEVMEAQWLGLSDDAAALIVGMHLKYMYENDVIHAIERRYRHHLAQAMEPGDDEEGADEEDDNRGQMEEKEGLSCRRRKAREEAKKRVAGLLRGVRTSLMSVDDLLECVKPSGLFTDAQLLAAYEHSGRTHRFDVQDPARKDVHEFPDVHSNYKITWRVAVQRTNAAEDGYEVHLRIEPMVKGARLPSQSAEVTIDVYCDRRHESSYRAEATTLVAVPGVLRVPFTAQPTGRVVIVIRVPPTAFTSS